MNEKGTKKDSLKLLRSIARSRFKKRERYSKRFSSNTIQDVSRNNSTGSMQVFSAFVTMQLPRNGAAGCHQVSRCDGTPRLSRPLNLLLEPRAPQHCGFCGRVDFITFLPVLARLLRRALPADHRPFYSALISARVMYTHYPLWQSAEMVMITRSLISWCGTSPGLLRARARG